MQVLNLKVRAKEQKVGACSGALVQKHAGGPQSRRASHPGALPAGQQIATLVDVVERNLVVAVGVTTPQDAARVQHAVDLRAARGHPAMTDLN